MAISGPRDHVHATLTIQDQTPFNNYLETGIGIFGHRGITTPHFWAFYKPSGVPPSNGTFFDLGPATPLGVSHRMAFRRTHTEPQPPPAPPREYWRVEINDIPWNGLQLPDVELTGIRWFGEFNENYNENNTQCDSLHASYTSASQVFDIKRFDPQFDFCHWQNFFSWEVYWLGDSPLFCFNPDPKEPDPGVEPPDFPSSPVAPAQ